MAKAVHARRRGDDFQAYCFWEKACAMLMPKSHISCIGFELGGPYKVFDDVAVLYSRGRPWRGRLVQGDFAQVKYSVNYSKALTIDSLFDPGFINAKTISLLQRLRDAVYRMKEEGNSHCFVLLAPWLIAPSDVLAELVRCEDGGLDMDRLFDGTGPRGKMGSLRERLTEHLALANEEELRPILERLRVDLTPMNLEQLRESLWRNLGAAGLRQFDLSRKTDPYCQLPWRIHADGTHWHDADSLREAVRGEGLWIGQCPTVAESPTRLGVRSFLRWAEDMEATTDHVLCLVDRFVGREIRDPRLWQQDILPSVQSFVQQHVVPGRKILLDIQSLGSVAFLLGYLIEPRLGVEVTLLQAGKEWRVRPTMLRTVSRNLSLSEMKLTSGGNDSVLAAGLTHDVWPAARRYALAHLLTASSAALVSPSTGSSSHAIENATEGFAMAEETIKFARRIRFQNGIAGVTHVFWSGPNAFSFFLGQASRSLGAVQLYEYNFDRPERGQYWPSLRLEPSDGI